jgi:hypothetical protein
MKKYLAIGAAALAAAGVIGASSASAAPVRDIEAWGTVAGVEVDARLFLPPSAPGCKINYAIGIVRGTTPGPWVNHTGRKTAWVGCGAYGWQGKRVFTFIPGRLAPGTYTAVVGTAVNTRNGTSRHVAHQVFVMSPSLYS